MTANTPNRSKVVHCSLNLTQASRLLGMTKWGFALPCNVVADGWRERKSSGNLISYAPTRLNFFNKIHAEKPYLPANLDSSGLYPIPTP